jgi:hypothetical protein
VRDRKRGKARPALALSMAAELHDIEQAVRGGVLLAEALRDSQLDADQLREVPASMVSSLALVQDRLHRLRLAVLGDLNPLALLWRHNSVSRAVAASTSADVFLFPWKLPARPHGSEPRQEHDPD